jgi:transcriptional regulator with XRE-family HTH domain
VPKISGFYDDEAVLRRQEMGRRFEFGRNKMRLSKGAFAKLIGVGPSSYTAWISGKSSPTVHSLSKMCEVTGIPSSFFNPEKLSDIRDVDRFAHDLVARLGVERVQSILEMSDDELAEGAGGRPVAAHPLTKLSEKFSSEVMQDIVMQMLLALETGLLDTILDSNRNILFSVALANNVDVEEIDRESRELLGRAKG